MAREVYRAQVDLLVRVLRVVAREGSFALKGGTAINLFHRGMPRLSVSFLHPADLHAGRHEQVIEERQAMLDAAYARNPVRFNRKPTVSRPPEETWINKPLMN